MKLAVIVTSVFVFLLSSCHTPSVLLAEDFRQAAVAYPVKGRQGLMLGQKLVFGDFETREIKRGWLKSYDIPFIIRFSGASEKIAFTLADSVSQARVYCLGKVRRQELELIRDYFGLVLKEEDAFAGNIGLPSGKNWDFVISNASNTNVFKETNGYLRCGPEEILVKAIRKMEGKNAALSSLGIYGYELIEDDRVIGAVDIMNKGRVYLRSSLGAEKKLLVSAFCSALLLRTDLDVN